MTNASNRTIDSDTYYEKHHIIPKSMGGSNKKENIVKLTGREHYIAHWLLHLIHPSDKKMSFAFWAMCSLKSDKHKRYTPSSRIVEYARINMANNSKGSKGSMWGKKHSTETIQKMIDAKLGTKHSNESIQKMSDAKLGTKNPFYKKTHQDSTKKSIAKTKGFTVEISGKKYDSVIGASRIIGISRNTITRRLKSSEHKEYLYL
jgi:hypothetical protein